VSLHSLPSHLSLMQIFLTAVLQHLFSFSPSFCFYEKISLPLATETLPTPEEKKDF